MRTRGRVKPSRPASALGMIVGLIFVVIGFTVAIPRAGAFGILWTVIAVFITLYHAINALSDRGIAHEVVEFETDQRPQERPLLPAPESVEDRLRKLEALKAQSLITETEYHEQRQRILQEL